MAHEAAGLDESAQRIDRRTPRARSQLGDGTALRVEVAVVHHQQPLGILARTCRKRALELGVAARIDHGDAQSRARGRLQAPLVFGVRRVVGIEQRRDARDARRDLGEHLDVAAKVLEHARHDARDVAARPLQAVGKFLGDGILGRADHDRRVGRGAAQRVGGERGGGEDHVEGLAREGVRGALEQIPLAVGALGIELHARLGVAELAHLALERVLACTEIRSGTEMEDADSRGTRRPRLCANDG